MYDMVDLRGKDINKIVLQCSEQQEQCARKDKGTRCEERSHEVDPGPFIIMQYEHSSLAPALHVQASGIPALGGWSWLLGPFT